MSWWVVGTTVAAAVVDTYNTKNTARKQDNALANKERMDAFSKSLASQRVNQLVNKTKQSSPVQIKNQDLGQYLNTIRRGWQATTGGLASKGKNSSAYDQAAADAASGISNYATTRAGNIAAVQAPMQQRQQEAIDRSNAGMDLNSIAERQKMQDFLANLRISSIHRNPWLDILSSGLKAYGGAKAAGATGGTPSGTGDTYTTKDGFTLNLPYRTQ